MLTNFWLNLKDGNRWYKFFRMNSVLCVLIFLYIPWIFIVALSFFKASDKGNFVPEFTTGVGFQNYKDFFTQPDTYKNFWTGLVNSLFVAMIVIPISLFVGIITSISMWTKKSSWTKYVFFNSNLSIATPDIIQAISFFCLFLVCFLPLGINLGTFTVIITHIAISIPYVIIFIYPKICKISPNIIMSSYDLKYSHLETVFNIIIPLLMPNILSCTMLVFTLSFDDFLITEFVRGNLVTISSEMYNLKKGIKSWVIVFGSILLWISFGVIICKCFWEMFKDKKSSCVIKN